MDRRVLGLIFCWWGSAALAFGQAPTTVDDDSPQEIESREDAEANEDDAAQSSGPAIYEGTDDDSDEGSQEPEEVQPQGRSDRRAPGGDPGNPFADDQVMDLGGAPSGGYPTANGGPECGSDCGPSCGCDDCGRGGGFWGRIETLGWWVRGSRVPALVTTSPPGTPQAAAGVLPDATILFGGERVNDESRIGGRATLGFWSDDYETDGVEANFWGLDSKATSFDQSSDGNPILARPFFNVQTGLQDAALTAFPGIVTGTINVRTSSEIYGAEANARHALYANCRRRVDGIAGYRFFRMNEDLNVDEFNTSVDPISNIPVGTTFALSDRFGTENEFHGGQVGLLMQYKRAWWTLNFSSKVALGNMRQNVNIAGNTRIDVPGGTPFESEGALLALGSNSGDHSRNRFSAIPEFGIDLAWQLNKLWTANVGYNFIYVTNVVRPGDQINLNLDPNQFPPAISGTQPNFAFNDTDVWIQGINLGLSCRF